MILGEDVQDLLDLAYAGGINAFDCARGYGDAEILLSKWMQECRNREGVVILTKCGNVGPDGTVCVINLAIK